MPIRRRTPVVVQVHTAVEQVAGNTCGRDEIVHAVERTKDGGLATAGRANHCGDLVATDLHVHVADGTEVAVEHAELGNIEDEIVARRLVVGHRGRGGLWDSDLDVTCSGG
jgi:hypothetical protein